MKWVEGFSLYISSISRYFLPLYPFPDDPYISTHTIITLTAKKSGYNAPRFGTCMYGMYDPYYKVSAKGRSQIIKMEI